MHKYAPALLPVSQIVELYINHLDVNFHVMHSTLAALNVQAVLENVMKLTSPAASTTSGMGLVLQIVVLWEALTRVETAHQNQNLLQPPIAGAVAETLVHPATLATAHTQAV